VALGEAEHRRGALVDRCRDRLDQRLGQFGDGLAVEDIARILRLPKDDISRVRQLSEIGLDSLMGVELGAMLIVAAPPASACCSDPIAA
jgi:hypothetical protein